MKKFVIAMLMLMVVAVNVFAAEIAGLKYDEEDK